MTIQSIGNFGSGTPASAVKQGVASSNPSSLTEQVQVTQTAAPTQEQIQQVVKEIKQLVEPKAPNSLAFSIDDTTGKTVIRVTDVSTGETIRQIPSEELLAISRSLSQSQGMLLRQQA